MTIRRSYSLPFRILARPHIGHRSPRGIDIDAAGNLFVADYANHLIRKITPGAVVTTLAGSAVPGSADGIGTAASFYAPFGLAIDSIGNVFVADNGNNTIRKITPGGVVITVAGSGAAGFVNGTGAAAAFDYPTDLAIDGNNNLFVTDFKNSAIRQITPAGLVTTFAGSGATGSTDATGTSASFFNPSGIAIDGAGNFFVADRNDNKVRMITAAGVVTTLAGSGARSSLDGNGVTASFFGPWAIAADASGHLYVTEDNGQVIRSIDLNLMVAPTSTTTSPPVIVPPMIVPPTSVAPTTTPPTTSVAPTTTPPTSAQRRARYRRQHRQRHPRLCRPLCSQPSNRS